ncbi:hypothetical protein SLEP1_g25122 [Rubroshorea leprosula]|uniref:Response regulatory domain-containing protein n=1 Tax=Rubroshorea leprosula TaxID=152421 RepID=A0AAV5JS50_9ROSI|nr:hypothetical protein SLEP1_g25122 [Rubroshorea leprosula]
MAVAAGEVFASGSQELHVLAVDDSNADRKIIERLLKISSCKVTAVESGTRALQFLGLDGEKHSLGYNGLKVNLIMTDYSMPGMTGYELLKKIKNILTRIDRCLEEGAEEFLVKPVKLSDVKRLKEFILKGEAEGSGERRVCKRNLEDDSHCSSSSLSSPSSSSSLPSSSPTHKEACDDDLAASEPYSPTSPLHPSKRHKWLNRD